MTPCVLHQKSLNEKQKNAVSKLWNAEYPDGLTYKDHNEFNEFLKDLRNKHHILMNTRNQKLMGWCCIFDRDGERWFSIIVDGAFQGHGFGKRLLSLAKEHEEELNGWVVDHDNHVKVNGEVYKSPLMFYEKNGFRVLKDFRFNRSNISAVKIRWTKV